jgi:hypothetical protein
MDLMRRALLLALISLLALVPAAASADTPVAVTPGPTNVAAYGGFLAWSQYDAGTKQYSLVVRNGDATPKVIRAASSPAPLEVSLGPDSKGRVVALYVRCTSAPKNDNDVANGCDAYRYQTSSGSQAKLGFSSPHDDEEWPAQWRGQFVFGRALMSGSGTSAIRCDIPYRRAVSGSTSSRMDRGSCAAMNGLAIRGTVVGQTTIARNASQVRLLSTNGGPVRVATSSSYGEESNYLGGPALDATYIYAARYGVHPTQSFVRIKRSGLAKQEVPARLALAGTIAIDGQTISYVEQMAGYRGGTCGATAPCRIVRSPSSPFGQAQRELPPELALTPVNPPYVPAAAPVTLTATLTRTTVSAGTIVKTSTVPGEPVELMKAGLEGPDGPYTSTGLRGTTGADGTAALTILPPQPASITYGAITRGSDPDTYSPQVLIDAQAVLTMTPSATTVASGAQVSFAGTLTPAQPGRSDVKIQRRTKQTCQKTTSGGQACQDEWETIATATTATDGGSYTAAAALTTSGVYTAVLPFLKGNTTALNGRSPEVTITVG